MDSPTKRNLKADAFQVFMERVGITGGTGFLGKFIVQELSYNHIVRVISSHEIPENLGHEHFVGEFTDDFLQKAVCNCHIVIHASAITNAFDPLLHEVNIANTARLVAAAKKEKVHQFIFISSENVTYGCKDPYTASKKEAERIALLYYKNALILRPSIIFGPGDRRYLWSFVEAIRRFPVVPVFAGKNSTIQPIHAEDVARIVHKGIEQKKSGIYTLVGAEPLSFQELGTLIARILGKKVTFITLPGMLFRPFLLISKVGPKKFKRFGYMIENALILRNGYPKTLEKAFGYFIPPVEKRLQEVYG